MEGATIRDLRPEDIEQVKAIHNATQIDYRFPDISSPLFVVTKVLETEGKIRACGGLYIQAETYLWCDPGNWATPGEKLLALQALDGVLMHDGWLKGIDCAVCWVPPGMERFGERLVKDLGFSRDRNGWVSYSKHLCG